MNEIKKVSHISNQDNLSDDSQKVQLGSGNPRAKSENLDLKGKDLFHQRYVEHFQQPTIGKKINVLEEAESIYNVLEVLQEKFSKASFNNLSFETCRNLSASLNVIKNLNQTVVISTQKKDNKSDLQYILMVYHDTLKADDISLNNVLSHLLDQGEQLLKSVLRVTYLWKMAEAILKLVVSVFGPWVIYFLYAYNKMSYAHDRNEIEEIKKELHEQLNKLLLTEAGIVFLCTWAYYCLGYSWNMLDATYFDGRPITIEPKQSKTKAIVSLACTVLAPLYFVTRIMSDMNNYDETEEDVMFISSWTLLMLLGYSLLSLRSCYYNMLDATKQKQS